MSLCEFEVSESGEVRGTVCDDVATLGGFEAKMPLKYRFLRKFVADA